MLRPLIAAALVSTTMAATSASSAAQANPTAVHVHTSSADGFLTNSVWIDDGKEVTVIDTQFTPALAEALVADIARQSRSPIRRVIVTHPNPDKFNALSVFHRLGAQSIASEATARHMPGVHAYKQFYWVQIAKAFTVDTYPPLELPRRTFSKELRVPLANGDHLTLRELSSPGVSATQTVVQLASTGDLIVGDLVANQTHAWMEGAVGSGKPVFDLVGWKASLRELLPLASHHARARLFAGRGPALPVAEAVQTQLAYLDVADQAISALESSLGPDRAALSDPQRQAPLVQMIRQRLVDAYPAHAMPELVSYSLYGWLASRAQ